MDALPDRERCEVADRAGPDGAERRELNGAKRHRIVWRNVILMGLLHAGALYSLLLIPKSHPFTWIWCKSENEVDTLGFVYVTTHLRRYHMNLVYLIKCFAIGLLNIFLLHFARCINI